MKMKLVKVVKNDASSDDFEAWGAAKRRESDKLRQGGSGVDVAADVLLNGSKLLRLRCYCSAGSKYSKEAWREVEFFKKAVKFCDDVAAECKRKFPEVKIEW